MTLNPEKWGFGIFFAFWGGAVAHISRVNWDEVAGDRPRQPAHEIFTIKRRFWQSKSQSHKFENACACERQKGIPVNNWLFYRY